MARLPFRTAFLFGSAAPANAIAYFGSEAAGSEQFSNPPDPAQIQSLSQWEGGWTAPTGAVTGTNQPSIEDVMAKEYVDSYFANYLQQVGIVEWDASGETPYDLYSVVNGALTTNDFQLYMSLKNGNTDALNNTNSWAKLGNILTGGGLAAAWAVFNGTNGAIMQGLNVASITRTSTGNYTATFTNSLSSATPAFNGNCAGLVRPISPGASTFTFDTAGLSGGSFSPTDYPYVSVFFYSL